MSRDATGLDFENMPFNEGNWEQLKKELARLRLNNEQQQIAIQLNSIQNFVMMHYAALPTARNMLEAFNELNDLYFDYYGEYRFSNYQKFCDARSNYLKRNK